VAHACNPRYLVGRDQEDHSSKPAQANSLRKTTYLEKLYLEKNHHKKRAGRVVQGIGPEFKPQYRKLKKKSYT
jgi:hypothetical protein